MINTDFDFLKSAVTLDSKVFSNNEVLTWIEGRRTVIQTVVRQIPLDSLRNWDVEYSTGDVSHASGGFFSIEGIRVRTNWGNLSGWDQPIIQQKEIGILGIIKNIKENKYLLQAKLEPGNINKLQLSPTVQATKSNYSVVHGGKRVLFLNFFLGKQIFKSIQSEQAFRYYNKHNANIILKTNKKIKYSNLLPLSFSRSNELRNSLNVDISKQSVI